MYILVITLLCTVVITVYHVNTSHYSILCENYSLQYNVYSNHYSILCAVVIIVYCVYILVITVYCLNISYYSIMHTMSCIQYMLQPFHISRSHLRFYYLSTIYKDVYYLSKQDQLSKRRHVQGEFPSCSSINTVTVALFPLYKVLYYIRIYHL